MATSRVLPPSSNPYGGGVILDSSPYTQFFLNQKAKQQAKDEALDNYFRNIDSKINSAGMRTQEINPLLQQQNEDRDFYLKNREAIVNPSKDNGKAYNEYMQRHQSKLAFVENSKKKAELTKQLVPIVADPNKRSLMGDEMMNAIALHDLPMTDPRHKEFNPLDFQYNPKPFDEQKYRTSLTPYVKETTGTTSFENLPDYKTSFMRTPKTQMIQNFDAQQVAKRAEDEYNQNPSYRKLINDIGNNPTQYQIHNDIYKQAFGKNLDIQHPEQIAIAHTLAMLPKNYIKEGKPEVDPVAFDAFKNARNYRQSLNKISANKVGQGQPVMEGNLLDNFGSTQKLTAGDKTIENGIVSDKNGNPFNGEFFVTKEFVPTSIYDVLKSSGSNREYLDKRNKGFMAIVKDGRIQALKDPKIGLIDRQSIGNAQLKFNTEPLKGKQPSFGKISTPIVAPKKDPLGLFKK